MLFGTIVASVTICGLYEILSLDRSTRHALCVGRACRVERQGTESSLVIRVGDWVTDRLQTRVRLTHSMKKRESLQTDSCQFGASRVLNLSMWASNSSRSATPM